MNRISLFFVLCLFSAYAQGQLCSGSLGDPVVNITFGSGGNPGPILRSTNYGYVSNDCPLDGFYTVRNSTLMCFGNTWHSLSEDHTPGDVNGYFMLVNASLVAGDFYLDTVKGLCENTTYEFAAWVINILRTTACPQQGGGINPNLTFNIETTTRTILGTYSTNNIAQTNFAAWNQYGLFFKTPAGVSNVVLRITNNAPGGCGNDLALDDITFRPCGPAVSASISAGGTGTTISFCEGNTTAFSIAANISTGYLNPLYQWQKSTDSGITWVDIAGANTTSFNSPPVLNVTTLYRLAVAEAGNINSPNCRIVSNTITATVYPLPITAASNNGPACENSIAILSANGGGQYAWTGPNGFTSSQQKPQFPATFDKTGLYHVTVTTDKGCIRQDQTNLLVVPNPTASVSPNQTICEGSSVILQASGGAIYNWSPAKGLSNNTAASPAASPSDTTLYKVIVSTIYGCKDSAFVTINVWKKPRAYAGPDKKIMEGETAILQGTTGGTNTTYAWSPTSFMTNANSLQPAVKPDKDFTYALTVFSPFGCPSAKDDVFVRVFKKVTIPNAFSPNNDGINDTWQITALETYPESVTEVHNRYGQLVFKSNGYNRPWNGTMNNKPLPSGTYYYVIDLKNDFPLLSGWVFIVR